MLVTILQEQMLDNVSATMILGIVKLENGGKNGKDSFYIPAPEKTHDFTKKCRFSFVDDEIFPLKHWLMRPYASKQLTDETRKNFN